MLWTSSFCFLVALEAPNGTRVAFISALVGLYATGCLPTNCQITHRVIAKVFLKKQKNSVLQSKQEPRAVLLDELAGERHEAVCSRYHMCMLPGSVPIAVVTWSTGGEDCVLLHVPMISLAAGGAPTESLPKRIKELPLPSTQPPIALNVGVIAIVCMPLLCAIFLISKIF